MSMSTARRSSFRVRTAVAVGAVAAVTLLAACSSSDDDSADSGASAPAAVATSDSKAAADGPVDVISQTNLLLVTAQETLEAKGLVVEVVDVTGQNRPVDDPTQWVVVTQDPESGTVDAGSTVTLEVRQTTDPIS
ncbi:PASTA domain-containing protein [Cellulomonas hominis]